VKLRIALAAASIALAACSGGEESGVITREQFVRANVALRAVNDTARDADSLRTRALRAEKVTPAQLRAWLQAHLNDPVLLAETWTEISRRADASDPSRHAAKPDSVGPTLTHGPPPPEIQPAPTPAPVAPPPPPANAPQEVRPRVEKPEPARPDTTERDSAAAQPDSAGS
jgi:hypothetical protein